LVVRKLIETAVADLSGGHPSVDASGSTGITPLDVVRWHVLGGEGWDSLEARLRQEGRPLSRGTLVRRQHDFLPRLAQWAKSAPEGPEMEARGVEGTGNEPRGHRRLLFLLVTAALLTATVLIALRWPAPEARSHSAPAFGEVLKLNLDPDRGRVLAAYPEHALPQRPAPLVYGVRVPRTDGTEALLLTARITGGKPGALLLWDPHVGRTLWDLRWTPPRDEVLMYDVEPEARDEPYWPSRLAWGRPELNLGRYVAVAYSQTWGPSFIVFVDLETGTEVCHYAHPGRLDEASAILDVDGDGQAEVLFGGQDNTVNRPTVVVLKVPDSCGAASTTNLSPGREGAFERILLTDLPEFRRAYHVLRLGVEFSSYSWKKSNRTLLVSVGGMLTPKPVWAYKCYLDLGGDRAPRVVLGDNAEVNWKEIGEDGHAMHDSIAAGIETLRR
jgi:hypothetical protein